MKSKMLLIIPLLFGCSVNDVQSVYQIKCYGDGYSKGPVYRNEHGWSDARGTIEQAQLWDAGQPFNPTINAEPTNSEWSYVICRIEYQTLHTFDNSQKLVTQTVRYTIQYIYEYGKQHLNETIHLGDYERYGSSYSNSHYHNVPLIECGTFSYNKVIDVSQYRYFELN